MTNILSDINKLAEVIAKEAAKDATPLQERLDALDKLTKYMVASKKAPEDAKSPMGDFAAIFHNGEDSDGTEKIRGRKRADRNRIES